jgi:hypothetical protein
MEIVSAIKEAVNELKSTIATKNNNIQTKTIAKFATKSISIFSDLLL